MVSRMFPAKANLATQGTRLKLESARVVFQTGVDEWVKKEVSHVNRLPMASRLNFFRNSRRLEPLSWLY